MTFDEFVDRNEATINRDGGKWVLSYTKNIGFTPAVHEIKADSLNLLKEKVEVYIYDNLIDSFYLEISGRQTGKTTRMVDAMIEHLSVGGSCILYCSKRRNFSIICEIINHKFGDTSNVHYYMDIRGQNLNRVRNYFDEFDFNPELVRLGAFDAKGYYCTTPSKLRDIADINNPKGDLLLELIKYSRFTFESRINQRIREYKSLDEKSRRIESGQIFK